MFKRDLNILVVGCGGLGCELVKALVLNGFKRISVVDHDRITVSNLNRQFLFRSCDVDKYKAQVVCEFLSNYTDTTTEVTTGGSGSCILESAVNAAQISCVSGNMGCSNVSSEGCRAATTNTGRGDTGSLDMGTPIIPNCYCCKIQQLDLETLSQFDVVLAALDSVGARRWLNWALFQIVARRQSPHGLLNSDVCNAANLSDCDPVAGNHTKGPRILLIDGGSQALYGHVRVVEPFRTPCIECTLGMFSPESPLPCIITNLTTAEHCVYHALNTHLDSLPGERTDGAQLRPEMLLERVYELSRSLAEANDIEGVTRDLVDQICNRSVPNVATTNTIVASLMVNLLLKKFNNGSSTDNFYFYTGDGSTGLTSFTLEPDKSCTVCGSKCIDLSLSRHTTLNELLSMLSQLTHSQDLNVLSDESTIYLGSLASLRDAYSHRLHMRLRYPSHYINTVQ